MTLAKAYRNILLIPAIVSMAGSISFAIWEGNSYKSEWLTADSMILVTIIICIFFVICFAIVSLPVFLHKYSSVRHNRLLSLGSWFLLPVTFSGLLLLHIIGREDFINTLIFLAILLLPFLAGLTWNYIQYRLQ